MTRLKQLQEIYDQIDRLSHIKKSDSAYWEAKQISSDLEVLAEGNSNINLDIKILDKYSFKSSDKLKKYFIDEFKTETLVDLRRIIFTLQKIADPSI